MTAVPGDTAVTIPEAAPTEATDGVLVVHIPPGVEFVSVIVEPSHTDDGPVMGLGSGLTFTVTDLKQPVNKP